jgi:hypothetical protein
METLEPHFVACRVHPPTIVFHGNQTCDIVSSISCAKKKVSLHGEKASLGIQNAPPSTDLPTPHYKRLEW